VSSGVIKQLWLKATMIVAKSHNDSGFDLMSIFYCKNSHKYGQTEKDVGSPQLV
jgi:hypothetical protein